jgi:transcriptional antiterminator RfaH
LAEKLLNKTEDGLNSSRKFWFALYTKPRHEFKAAEHLKLLGIHHYLPVVSKKKQWSDRKKIVTEPLMRGYIFIFADEKERLLALEEYSIVRCIFDNGKPAVIPEWQMDNLARFLKQENEFYLHEGLIPGTKVLIKSGPFEGVVGVVLESENHNMFSVSIDLLNRSVITHIAKNNEFEVLKRQST